MYGGAVIEFAFVIASHSMGGKNVFYYILRTMLDKKTAPRFRESIKAYSNHANRADKCVGRAFVVFYIVKGLISAVRMAHAGMRCV